MQRPLSFSSTSPQLNTANDQKVLVCCSLLAPHQPVIWARSHIGCFNAKQKWNRNVRKKILIFCHGQNIVHEIGWVSRLARRIARSPRPAEHLVATDVVNKITYFSNICIWSKSSQTNRQRNRFWTRDQPCTGVSRRSSQQRSGIEPFLQQFERNIILIPCLPFVWSMGSQI